MRLYDNARGDNYENLKTLYPVWYRDVLEMDALWGALGPQLDDIQKGLTQAVDNGFIWTADEPTIAKLEEFLYIPVNRAKQLIERKTLVASFSIGNGHIGEKEIKAVISIFTDGKIEVALVGGTIEVSVTREISDRFNLADCLYILLKKIPAHLGLVFHDILKPILFQEKNALRFHSFGVSARFSNRGQTEPVLLTGRRLLDGTWTLDQVYSGVVFQLFQAAASFFTRNAAAFPVQAFRTALAPNAFAIRAGPCRFRTQFFNNSETERVMLDGRRVLDGSWLLNQELKGVVFPAFCVAVFAASLERAETPRIAFSELTYKNAYHTCAESFGLAQGFHNETRLRHGLERFRLQGQRQSYSLNGSVTMDSMYELNGSALLDGSRKLNAQIIKEDF